MRTRKEQITQLKHFFINLCPDLPPSGKQALAAVAKNFIEEAEQRVRAEIARDSERLDWLEGIVEAGFRVSPMGRGISGASFNHGYGDISAATLRSAIDAAREAQE